MLYNSNLTGAHIAQLVEHFHGKEEVAGSIPAVGTICYYIFSKALQYFENLILWKGNNLINSSKFIPSEVTKTSDLSEFNQFPVTLEEEVVFKMAPLVKSGSSEPAKYKPVAGPIHDAVSPDYQGTI